MSVRQDVFNYLSSKPDAPLDEVLGTFSGTKETTVRRYYFEHQKADKKVTAPKKKKTTPKKTATPKKSAPAKKTKNNN